MRLFMALIGVGLIMIIAGFILMALSATPGNVSGGFVILIGPIPIIGGFGPYGGLLSTVALIATIIIVLIYIFYMVYLSRRPVMVKEEA